MIAKLRANAPLLEIMVKLQSVMVLIAALVIYLFDARTFGKILAVVTLFTVISVAAFVHLQQRYRSPTRASARS